MRAFPAQFETVCPACGEGITEGDPIWTTLDGAVHGECYDQVPAVTPNPCPVCWLFHPPGVCDR